jgi:Chaperone of endosialidase
MSVTINAKGTSVSTFTVGKNGLQLAQIGEITPPAASDLVFNLNESMGAVFRTGVAPSSIITTTDGQGLIINPGLGGGGALKLINNTWPTTDGTANQVLTTNGLGVLFWSTGTGGGGGSGTVTSVAVSGANGISVTGSPITTNGTIALSLGAITPTSISTIGSVTASSFSGAGTGLTGTATGLSIGGNAATSTTSTTTTTLTTSRAFSASGDATATAQNFNGSADVVLPMVLATVNAVPQTDTFRKITVNGKGLVTATSAVTAADITPLVNATYVLKAGDTMTGPLVLTASAPSLSINATAAGTTASLLFNVAGNSRWSVFKSSTTESGGGTGSAFGIGRYTDAGTFVDAPLTITRSTGASTFLYSVTAASLIPSGSTIPVNGLFLPAANVVGFANNSLETMRIDATGRVGVGVTPSNWVTTYKTLDIGSGGMSIAGRSDSGSISLNSYWDGTNWRYKATGGTPINYISLDPVGLAFSYAPSGTADAIISWTTAMRIDTAGNVGIGLAPPTASARLHVRSSSAEIVRLESTSSFGNALLTFYNFSGQKGYVGYNSGSDDTMSLANLTNAPLTFLTNAAERMRIDASGFIGIGATTVSGRTINVAKTLTGGGAAAAVYSSGAIASDVTTLASSFTSSITTAASAFTLPTLYHFLVSPTIKGAGSTITTQIGYSVSGTLLSGTNNYAFHSVVDRAANTYNLAMIGTADNYLGGNTGINISPGPWGTNFNALEVNGAALWGKTDGLLSHFSSNLIYNGTNYKYKITGTASSYSQDGAHHWLTAPLGTVGPNAILTERMTLLNTGNLGINNTNPAQALDVVGNILASGTITGTTFVGAVTGNVTGSASLNVLKAGDVMTGTLTINSVNAGLVLDRAGATNQGINWKSGGLNRWYWYSTADGAGGNAGSDLWLNRYDDSGVSLASGTVVINRLTGGVGIGTSTGVGIAFRVTPPTFIGDGTLTTAYQIFSSGVFPAGTTASGYGMLQQIGTAAAAFTLPNLYLYTAAQGTIGAGSTVTSQYGFYASPSMTGATSNYGFFGNIAKGTNRWNFYMGGSAQNYISGNLGIGSGKTVPTVALDITGDIKATGNINIGEGSNTAVGIEIGNGRTTNNVAYLDFHSSTPSIDYDGRLSKLAGATGSFQLINKNGISLDILNENAAPINFYTSSTERMRVDIGGNVGIGITNPQAKLDIYGNGVLPLILRNVFTVGGSNSAIQIVGDASTPWGYIGQVPASGGLQMVQGAIYNVSGNWTVDTNSTNFANIRLLGDTIFFNNNGLTPGGQFQPTERMRLTVNGNLGIGTSAPQAQVHILSSTNEALRLESASPPYMSWLTTGPNPMGYIGIGNLATGKPASDFTIRANTNLNLVANNGNSTVLQLNVDGNLFFGNGVGGTGRALIIEGASRPSLIFRSATVTWSTALKGDIPAESYYMISNPSETVGVYMTTTASGWTNLSDERYKENYVELTGALQSIKNIRAGSFSWVADPTLPRDVGLMAQDLIQIMPEVVDTSNTEKYGIRYSAVIPYLVKALQEANSLIEDLQARITALET